MKLEVIVGWENTACFFLVHCCASLWPEGDQLRPLKGIAQADISVIQ